MPRVAIIGGGISGLVCAYRLSQVPGMDVVLFEASGRLGGVISSHTDGATVVEDGPDGFIAWRPQGLSLCDELDLRVIRSQPARSSIAFRGRLHPIPAGLAGGLPTQVRPMLRSSLFSPVGKLRLLCEGLVPARRGAGDESAMALVTRRAGRQVWQRVVEPLVAGMYAAQGQALSARAVLPLVADAERRHGSITRAAIRSRRLARSGAGSGGAPVFCTTPGGLGAMIGELERRLLNAGVEVVTGSPVTHCQPVDRQWRVAVGAVVREFDAVVAACPANVTASLTDGFDSELATMLRTIPIARTAVAWMQFAADDVPDIGLGYVVPAAEGSPVVAVSVYSRKYPELCEPGHVVLRVFVGRHGDDPMADRDVLSIARGHLLATADVHATPRVAHVVQWEAAFPQYTVGHHGRVDDTFARVGRHPGFVLAGASYRGIGIPDCIASGDDAARAVSAAFGAGEYST